MDAERAILSRHSFKGLRFDIRDVSHENNRPRVFCAALYLKHRMQELTYDERLEKVNLYRELALDLNNDQPDFEGVSIGDLMTVNFKVACAWRCLDTHLTKSPSVKYIPTHFYKIAGELAAIDSGMRKAFDVSLAHKLAAEEAESSKNNKTNKRKRKQSKIKDKPKSYPLPPQLSSAINTPSWTIDLPSPGAGSSTVTPASAIDTAVSSLVPLALSQPAPQTSPPTEPAPLQPTQPTLSSQALSSESERTDNFQQRMNPLRYASVNMATQASTSSRLPRLSPVSEAKWDQEDQDQDQGYEADYSNDEPNLVDERSLELRMWSMERKVDVMIDRKLEPFKEKVHELQATIRQLQSMIEQQQSANDRLTKENEHLRQDYDTLVNQRRKDVLSTMARERDYIGRLSNVEVTTKFLEHVAFPSAAKSRGLDIGGCS